jgi:acetoin utilization deacetylase AcuC-like enzyme
MKSIPVFFTPKMVAPSGSFSPSAAKPAQVVESWRNLDVPLAWHEPAAATPDDFKRAHQAQFVDDVLSCKRGNGFGNTSEAVAASLPYTTGAMLSAARHVLRAGAPVAAAPCSGFHHAGWRSVGGFCTFNGLMVTAAALTADGDAKRVGILDCDEHYGDGTDDILDAIDGARSWVNHYTAGAHWHFAAEAPSFLEQLAGVVRTLAAGCDVVLYQAGADPHVDDPLGGWLTTAQLRQRDAIVFETLRALHVPVVWNLAGGYQVEADGSIPKVLEIHDNTMRECARVYVDHCM